MLRQLVLGTFALLTLGIVGLACGGPSDEVAPGSPAAQATDTRRTAIAEVQRIIANKPTATPPPSATATPTPTCQNAIWWTEARSHIGESRVVQGTVVATRPGAGGAVLIEIGQPYPDPTGLVAVAPNASLTALQGNSVCITGRIALSQGRPVVTVADATAIRVLGPAT